MLKGFGWLGRLLSHFSGTKFKLKGYVHIIVKNRRGKILHEQWVTNAMVAQGKERLMKYLAGTYSTLPTYLAISSNSSTPADSETSVPNLILAKSATKTYELYNNQHSVKFTITVGTSEGNGSTISSVALCENNTGGGEWCRAVLSSPINKTSDISVEINYYWSYS